MSTITEFDYFISGSVLCLLSMYELLNELVVKKKLGSAERERGGDRKEKQK